MGEVLIELYKHGRPLRPKFPKILYERTNNCVWLIRACLVDQ